jgi:hypothetical protein
MYMYILNFVQHIIICKYLRHLRQYCGMSEHVERNGVWKYTASDWARGCSGTGEQGKWGRLTSLDVPLLLSTSCREFVGHLISLSCAHVIEKGNGVLVVISLWYLLVVCPQPSTRGGAMTWRLCGRLWCCDVAHHPTAVRPEPLT